MMKKIYKHRIALLIGLLVALVFFYLGVNRWIESQQSMTATPPPIVRSKEPVQIKPESPEVSADTTEVEEFEEDTEDTVAGVEEPQTVRMVSAVQNEDKNAQSDQQPKRPVQTHKEENKPTPENKTPGTEPAKHSDTEKRKANEQKIVIKTFEKEFVVQVGAFKKKENAENLNKKMKEKGFESFIIEEEGLYKVRVRKMGSSWRDALEDIKGESPDAFIVR